MSTYRLVTTVSEDGTIMLPGKLKNMFSHCVEIIIKDNLRETSVKDIDIPVLSCGGKATHTDFSREDIYDYRF